MCYDLCLKVWPQQLFQLFPLLKFSEENRLENQLKELGLKVSDIDYVVFSHLHLDHTGQAYMFKDTFCIGAWSCIKQNYTIFVLN
ncbi:MBL fold metallo-hydrolase [Candidatus Acidianus copahuensis]|uniref:MBL fold metallo-hydrolase n=1 Tax=Candidatus Acidianus copahuensis TaxID=1160895 RepID=UPI0009DC9C78|nr:MBL fold metallo-hydrolase [Candidatus Acidianus copahuensis]